MCPLCAAEDREKLWPGPGCSEVVIYTATLDTTAAWSLISFGGLVIFQLLTTKHDIFSTNKIIYNYFLMDWKQSFMVWFNVTIQQHKSFFSINVWLEASCRTKFV